MTARHRRGQYRAARRAGLRIMVDGDIGRFSPAKRRTRMAFLTARLVAGRFPQTADPWWPLQPVAGGRFPTVGTVQPEAPLQFRRPLQAMYLRSYRQTSNDTAIRPLHSPHAKPGRAPGEPGQLRMKFNQHVTLSGRILAI